MDITQLTRIFCQVDDFCKELNQYQRTNLLPDLTRNVGSRGQKCCLSESEIMTILIFFNLPVSEILKIFILIFLAVTGKKNFLICLATIDLLKL